MIKNIVYPYQSALDLVNKRIRPTTIPTGKLLTTLIYLTYNQHFLKSIPYNDYS